MTQNKPKRTPETTDDLMERARELIHQGNIRRFVLRGSDGNPIVDFPLTGVVVGTVIAVIIVPGGLFWLFLAIGIGIIAKLRVEILREITEEDNTVQISQTPNPDEPTDKF